MILKMSSISIIGPQKILPDVMSYIYEAGVLHITSPNEDVTDTPYVRRLTMTLEQRNEMAELERVLGIAGRTMNVLKKENLKQGELEDIKNKIGIAEAKTVIEEISSSADNLNREIKEIEQQLSLYTRYEKILTSLSPLIEMLPDSPFRDYTGITLYKRESPLPVIEQAIHQITGARYELFRKDIDEEIMACVIIYPKEFGQEIKRLFQAENISEIRMPADLTDMPLMEALRTILNKKTELPLRLRELEAGLNILASERYEELINCFHVIEERLRQDEVIADLYGTNDTFYLCGWLPQNIVHTFSDNIKNRFNNMVIISELIPRQAEMEKAPVLLSNPAVVRPFEVLTRFLSLPEYGTFDPTPLMALFFPVFFGFILGDTGYGMIIFILSLAARMRWKQHETVRDMGNIFMISSLCAVFFGVVFGELFGDLGMYIGMHHYIDRSNALIPLIIFSVIIGGLHISLGLIIGIFISLKRREKKGALIRGFKLLFVFSVFGAAASGYGVLHQWMSQGFFQVMILLAVVIIAALILLEKWIAPFDALKLIVNILSYIRIMGFGAASVYLASIANKLSAMPRSIITGIIIGVFFHLINLAVGVYAPAIQTLRLHYVEFFDKFFYPGGIEYKPFGRGRKVVI